MWFPPAIVIVSKGYLWVIWVEWFAPCPRHHGRHEDEYPWFDDLSASLLRQLLRRFRGFLDPVRRVDDVEDDHVGLLQCRVQGIRVGLEDGLRNPLGLLALGVLMYNESNEGDMYVDSIR